MEINGKKLKTVSQYEQEAGLLKGVILSAEIPSDDDISKLQVIDEKLALVDGWINIGNKNHWISRAVDPPFDENSFVEAETVEDLIEFFKFANWCLGSAIFYKNLCFINQVGGGDEWLVIRDDIPFESWSCNYSIKENGQDRFINVIDRMFRATGEQLRKLDY